MATYRLEETKDSRNGSQISSSGGVEPRKFLLYIENLTPAERAESRYPNPKGIVQQYFIPSGSYHPWNAFMRADDFSAERYETCTDVWLIRIGYMPVTSVPQLTDDWQLSIRSASVSVQQRETLPDNYGQTKLIGPPEYRRATVEDDDANTYYARLPYTNPETQKTTTLDTRLVQMSDSRVQQPQTVELPALSVTMSMYRDNWPLQRIVNVGRYIKRINSERMRFANYNLEVDKAMVFFQDFTMDEVAPREAEESRRAGVRGTVWGVAARVSLQFLVSSIPFDPLSLVHTVRSDTGHEAYVRWNEPSGGHQFGDLVAEDFLVKRRADLNDVFTLFKPPVRRGPIPTPV